MKIGILGTGTVGQTLGHKLLELGHDVVMGSRSPEKAQSWAKASKGGKAGTFAQAAAHGELNFNCTMGSGTLEALKAAGAPNLEGKVLVDLSNPLDFSKGMPPTMFSGNTDSLGEQIQRAFPGTKVVKTLNTLNAELMVNPRRLRDGEHDVFVSGNDSAAKAKVSELLKSFGWKHIIDLGDISTARGTESLLPLWLRLWGALKTPEFNFKNRSLERAVARRLVCMS